MFNKYKKYLIILLIILFILLLGYILKTFVFDGFSKTETEIALETYFDSKKKSGEFSYNNYQEETEYGRFWVDDDKFLIEFDQPDGFQRWLLSPDGENVYYCYEEDEDCIIGVVSVENYLLRWYKPSSDLENLGVDEENDCEKIKYTVDKLYDVEGASNAYFVDYVMYCVKDGDLIYREHSGHVVSNEDGEADETKVTQFFLDDVNLDADFEGVSFDVRYEMREN